MALKTLPIGVDIGATRLRLVATAFTDVGPRVQSVVTRELSCGVSSSGAIADCQYMGAILEEACDELQVRERRCVISVGEPEAVLRAVEFPNMTGIERERAAVFEAQRYVDYDVHEAFIRLHPIDEKKRLYALGIVRAATLRSRMAALKAGGLRPVAIDHEALALRRALPGYDAILDIGFERSSVHIMSGQSAPLTLQHVAGGAEITRGIERELSIDTNSAEKRKRILGTVGAGESARGAFLADITSLLESAALRAPIRRIALSGNGARLNNFAVDLERATGLLVEIPVSGLFGGDAYPADVSRAAAPDWNLAAGLSTWMVNVA